MAIAVHNVADAETHEVAASEHAIDGHCEQATVARRATDVEMEFDRGHMLRRNRGFLALCDTLLIHVRCSGYLHFHA